jgi:predicted DNA-binding transcriptional regulator YafY
MRALEAGGVPIGAEAGLGYFIGEGYHVPPVMFTREEARALLIGGKVVESFTDKSIQNHFENALTKVRSVLDMEKKDDLDSLDKDIVINPFLSNYNKQDGSLHFEQIQSALAGARVVEIEYFSRGKGEETKRALEPIGLTFYADNWHLIAWCRLRKDYRDFRLDRIARLKVLNEGFKRFRHPRLNEYLESLAYETELEFCTLQVEESVHPFLENSKYRMGLIREERTEEGFEMHFASYSLETIARWVLMMGKSVKVISPDSLNQRVKELVTELASYHT